MTLNFLNPSMWRERLRASARAASSATNSGAGPRVRRVLAVLVVVLVPGGMVGWVLWKAVKRYRGRSTVTVSPSAPPPTDA